MKPLGEVNLRKRLEPVVHEAARRAAEFVGQWHFDNRWVLGPAGEVVCTADHPIVAQHIADCHNHFLTLYNMLLFREHSEEDLDEPEPKPSRPKSQIPTTARSRRFPVPAERPRPGRQT